MQSAIIRKTRYLPRSSGARGEPSGDSEGSGRAPGAGEPATCPTAAAVGNAVFDATGVRLRRTPFRSDRVKAAFT